MRSLAVLVVAACLFADASSAEEPADEKQKLGYGIGYQVGSDFRRQGIAIDPEMVVRGVRDALSGAEPAVPLEEMRAALTEVRRQAATAAREQREEQARSAAPGRGSPPNPALIFEVDSCRQTRTV
jgi:FKBP-type peptidyl-prolyl cis-trans isomerase FklB